MLATSRRKRRATTSTSVLSHAPFVEAEYCLSHPALFLSVVWCDHRLQFYIFIVMFFVFMRFIFSLAYRIKKQNLKNVRQAVLCLIERGAREDTLETWSIESGTCSGFGFSGQETRKFNNFAHKIMVIICWKRKYRKSKEHRAKMYNFLI